MSLWLAKGKEGEVAIGESHRPEGWGRRASRKVEGKQDFLQTPSEVRDKQELRGSVWT